MNTGYSIFNPPYDDWRNQEGMWIDSSGWNDLVNFLNDCSKQHIAAKNRAELISPIRYDNDYRGKKNALYSGAWIFLDVDDGDFDRDLSSIVELGVEAYIYATASHTPDKPKFRIVVPTTEPFAADLYFKAAHGLNAAMKGIGDTSKLGCDSWCFIPAIYNEHTFEPIHLQGAMFSAEEWISYCPETTVELLPAEPIEWVDFKNPKCEPRHNSLIDYMNSDRFSEYASIIGGQGKTAGLYKLMISTCQLAILDGYRPNQNEVAQTAQSIDLRDGGYHQTTRPATLINYAANSAPTIIATAQNHAQEMLAEREAMRTPKPLPTKKPTLKPSRKDMGNGLSLQNLKCGIPTSLWKPLDVAAHWKSKNDNSANDVCIFLSDKVTHIGDFNKYAIKNNLEGGWLMLTDVGRTTATLNQEWGDYIELPQLPAEDASGETPAMYDERRLGYVKKYVQKQMKSINSLSTLPINEEFIHVNGVGKCLNNYIDEVLPFAETVDIQKSIPILRMIKYSLCNEDVIIGKSEEDEYKQIISEILGSSDSNLRWVMHWLSKIRQNIGIVSGVALVMHGASTGIGKNTLSMVMGKILGSDMCKPIESHDFDKGWTDAAVGGIWIHADDWKNGKLKEHEALLKQFITNDVCSVNMRHIGNLKRVNTSSWYITNNEIDPIAVDDNERRYTVIETTYEQDLGRKLSKIVYDYSLKNDDEWLDMLGAFNNLLCCIPIDYQFVMLPLENEHREELKEMNKNPIELWLDDMCMSPMAGKPLMGTTMFDMFKEWHSEKYREDTKYGHRGFGMALKNHPKKCMKKRTERGIEWHLTKTESLTVPIFN